MSIFMQYLRKALEKFTKSRLQVEFWQDSELYFLYEISHCHRAEIAGGLTPFEARYYGLTDHWIRTTLAYKILILLSPVVVRPKEKDEEDIEELLFLNKAA